MYHSLFHLSGTSLESSSKADWVLVQSSCSVWNQFSEFPPPMNDDLEGRFQSGANFSLVCNQEPLMSEPDQREIKGSSAMAFKKMT